MCREQEDREKNRICQLIKDKMEQERKMREQKLQKEEKERYVKNVIHHLSQRLFVGVSKRCAIKNQSYYNYTRMLLHAESIGIINC